MIVVDTSALAAVLLEEADAAAVRNLLGAADARTLSAANYLELGIVIAGRGLVAGPVQKAVDQFLAASDIGIAPVTEEHARAALRAHLKYGKGRGHRARLNFGDCFAYALAKSQDAPLLFVGDDFAHTDIKPAL